MAPESKLAARSHLVFLGALVIGLGIVFGVEHLSKKATPSNDAKAPELSQVLDNDEGRYPLRPAGQLAPDQLEAARRAWSYFEKNTRPETGLADAIAGFPSTTLWDTGSYLTAILAAERVGIIDAAESNARLTSALQSLAKLPLCDGKLPNKAYDTRTLAMVNYDNSPAPDCIGWSAIDVARIGVPFSIIAWQKPDLTDEVRAVVSRWDLSAAVHDGELQGSERGKDGKLALYQEGRIGYEQYAARSLLLLGADVGKAIDPNAHVSTLKLGNIVVPVDDRDPSRFGGTPAPVLSEPFVLLGLEFGLDATSLPESRAVLHAQEDHAKQTGTLVCASEDAIDRAPHFVYTTVVNGTTPWAAYAPDGTPAPDARVFSTKAAFGWAALFGGEYTQSLQAKAMELVSPDGPFFAGAYEKGGEPNRILSANTQAVILESLAYRAGGPLLKVGRQSAAAGGARR